MNDLPVKAGLQVPIARGFGISARSLARRVLARRKLLTVAETVADGQE